VWQGEAPVGRLLELRGGGDDGDCVGDVHFDCLISRPAL